METIKTVLIYAAMATVMGWAAVFVCVLLNSLFHRTSPDFLNVKGSYQIPNNQRPSWLLRVILFFLGAPLIVLLVWSWVILIAPFFIIKQGQRLMPSSRG